MAEAETLKAQIGRLDKFSEIKGWMDQPATGISLAAPTPAGETVIETSATKSGDRPRARCSCTNASNVG